jgi:hypothetical protein
MNERLAIVGGSIGVTLGMLIAVLGLGGWAFEQRQLNQHNLRLQRLLEKEPAAAAVTAGILQEPDTQLLASRAGAGKLIALLEGWPTDRRDAVLGKAREWPRTDVFSVGPMFYFLYFDADGVMRDFVCLPS